MSRSYKKTPCSNCRKDKFYKKYANRQLRRQNRIFQHNSYKRTSNSWNICEYQEVGTTFEDFYNGMLRRWHDWEWEYEPYPSKEKCYKMWLKYYKRK